MECLLAVARSQAPGWRGPGGAFLYFTVAVKVWTLPDLHSVISDYSIYLVLFFSGIVCAKSIVFVFIKPFQALP